MQVVRMLSLLLATLYWQQGIHPRNVRIRSELVCLTLNVASGVPSKPWKTEYSQYTLDTVSR